MSAIPYGLMCGAVFAISAQGRCHACKGETPLFAMMALPPFTFADPDEEAMDDGGFMLRNVDGMSERVIAKLDRSAQRLWRRDFSFTAGESYWMNHCERCDAKQGDHHVQGPDGPFWPYTPAQMAAIKAERVG